MKVHVKRISPASLSAVLGLVGAMVGLLFGIVGYALGSTGLGGSHWHHGCAAGNAWVDALSLLVFGPAIDALGGVIAGFVIAWIYNFIARLTKGILIELEAAGRHED